MKETRCFGCKNLIYYPSCLAFPAGIPKAIRTGTEHTAVIEGQNGSFVFDPFVTFTAQKRISSDEKYIVVDDSTVTVRSLAEQIAKDFLLKHGTHDQSTHGRRGSGGVPAYTGKPRKGMGDIKIPVEDLQKKGTARKHLREDGTFTPERQAFHDRVVAKYLKDIPVVPQGVDPVYTILGGGSASGKSTIKEKRSDVVDVDCDHVKSIIADEDGIDQSGRRRGWSQYTHEEASYIAKRVVAASMETRRNVTLDGTGDSSPASLSAKIAQGHAMNYKVRGLYVTCSIDQAISNEKGRVERAKEKRRLDPNVPVRGVPRKKLLETHMAVSRTLPEVINKFDSLELYDTNIQHNARLVLSRKNGETTVVNHALWNDFTKKANYDVRGKGFSDIMKKDYEMISEERKEKLFLAAALGIPVGESALSVTEAAYYKEMADDIAELEASGCDVDMPFELPDVEIVDFTQFDGDGSKALKHPGDHDQQVHDPTGGRGAGSGGQSTARLPKGSMAERCSRGTKRDKDEKLVQENGKPLPEHIAHIAIPPAWTDVRYNPDPKGDLLVMGLDKKGKWQPKYSTTHDDKKALIKFARVDELDRKFTSVVNEIDKDRKSKDPVLRAHADCQRLIATTAIRPGSDKDTKADKQAYGATTLSGHHVVSVNGKVQLQFVGKHGVDLAIDIDDKETASMMLKRAAAAGKKGLLFPNIEYDGQLDYTKKLDGGSFLIKDFRTRIANKVAVAEFKKIKTKPTTEKEYKKACKAVAVVTAAKLGNTPEICLKKYINPALFAPWKIDIVFAEKKKK